LVLIYQNVTFIFKPSIHFFGFLQMKFSNAEIKTAFWAALAAFGAYFCMYAFRKPFAAASFSGLALGGVDYKIVLIISQLVGYLISKFVGIKFISELKSVGRIQLLLGLLGIAELALIGFAMTPFPYNFVWLFVNGLPLGMVFGIVFSFLEGRKLTELMSLGLGVSIIFASGAVKSVGKILLDDYHISPWWMPALTGLIFVPILLLSLWMLLRLPPPSVEDIAARTLRKAMSSQERRILFKKYAFGIVLLVFSYILLTSFRDIRDNFAVEIWSALGFSGNAGILASAELMISLLILVAIGGISFLKNNAIAFYTTLLFVVFGGLILGVSTFLFQQKMLSPTVFMVSSGFGLFLGYTVFQGILFERMIAHFQEAANVGFLMYLADAFGYLGSAGVLIFKNFGNKSVDWLTFFTSAAYITSLLTVFSGLLAFFYFKNKYNGTRI
jgi:hypothetical protein